MKSSPFRRLISALIAVSVISGTVVPAGAEDSDDECNHIHTSVQWDDIYWQELCLDCGAQTGTGVRLGGPPEDEESNPGTQESNDTAVSDENQDDAGNEADEAPEAPVLTNEVCYFCEDQISTYQAGGSSAYMVFDVMDNLRHRVCVTCPDCGDYRTFDEEHRFLTAKSAEQYNSEQHRTSKTCSACGYGLFEYADHDWKFGSWESIGNGMCVRTKECSICGLSRSETETFDTEETTVSPGQGSMNTGGGQRGGNDCPEVQPDSGGASALPGTQPVETPLPYYPVTVQPGTSHVEENHSDNSDTVPVNQTEAGNTWNGTQDNRTGAVRQISVTVPEQLSLYVTEQGAVYSADSAKIINNSENRVKVSGVTVNAAGGWMLAPYGLEMAMDEPAGRLIGFTLNGCATTKTGMSEALSLSGDWTIRGGGSLPLHYDAVMSLPYDLTTGEQVLTLVFVLDWA